LPWVLPRTRPLRPSPTSLASFSKPKAS
jgi:hypothetical protein